MTPAWIDHALRGAAAALGCTLAFAAPAEVGVCGDGAFPLEGVAAQAADGADQIFAVVDLDGDGANELLTFDGTLRVYSFLATGEAILLQVAPSSPPGLAGQHQEMAVADMDGDDDLDVAITSFVASTTSPSLGYFRNNGGTFMAATTYAGSAESLAVAAGDLNADGIGDIAVASYVPAAVRLYRGVAGGNPALQISLSASAFVRGVALGDIDGDGDLDVVASCTRDGGVPGFVQAYRNDGAWSFAPLPTRPLGFKSREVRCGDLDGDGFDDATVMSLDTEGQLAILVSDGVNLQLASIQQNVSQSVSHRLDDVDGDGDLDVVALRKGLAGCEVRVDHNLGDGTFAPPWYGHAALDRRSLGVGDLNGDGRAELMIGHTQFYNPFPVAPGRADGTFAMDQITPLPASGVDVVVGDLDGDCLDDVVVLSFNGQFATVHLSAGTGQFAQVQQFNANAASPFAGLALDDFDGDGDVDIALGRTGQVQRRLNDGTGVFGAPQVTSVAGVIASIRGGDLDGDGDTDLVVTSNAASTIRHLLNNGAGTFTLAGPLAGATGESTAVELGDLDADGDLDIVGFVNPQVRTWHNDGQAGFTPGPLVAANAAFPNFALGDFDQDGDTDVASRGGGQNNAVYLSLNDGSGAFGPQVVVGAGLGPARLYARDLDGDGLLDLLDSSYGGPTCRILRGLGNGVFALPEYVLFRAAEGRLGIGHVDLDGRLDLIATPPSRAAFLVARSILCPPDDVPAGDVNHDHLVDGCDLGFVLAAWGTSGAPTGFADLDGSGVVDGGDLGLVLAGWTNARP